jgi:hypothetical protein
VQDAGVQERQAERLASDEGKGIESNGTAPLFHCLQRLTSTDQGDAEDRGDIGGESVRVTRPPGFGDAGVETPVSRLQTKERIPAASWTCDGFNSSALRKLASEATRSFSQICA